MSFLESRSGFHSLTLNEFMAKELGYGSGCCSLRTKEEEEEEGMEWE